MKLRKTKKVITFLLALMIIFSAVPALSGGFALGTGITSEAATAGTGVGYVKTAGGNLNVRSAAGTGYGIITRLANGSVVTIAGSSNGFYYVEYADGKYGWCSASYISVYQGATPAYVNITSGYLNVRSGAGTSYSIKDKLVKGEYVTVLSSSGGWCSVFFDGNETGYVSSAYLRYNSVPESNKAVKLNVVSFKQTDPRCSWVTLGTSGKTIGSIGCTTTCLAMTESYRQGSTITPATQASRLSYSSTGSLYWPSNYIPDTSSSGWLAKVHSLLEAGKPVIVGAKNSYGGMHWVVATGFNVGEISYSSFTVNDPGSNSRTLLSHFMSAYPQFYKLAYYS